MPKKKPGEELLAMKDNRVSNDKIQPSNLEKSDTKDISVVSNKTEETNIEVMQKDKEKIMNRLLESVNMVKDVLQTNLTLRQQMLEMSKQLDQSNIEIYHLQTENEEYKEKMQIMANGEYFQPNYLPKLNESTTTKYKNRNVSVVSELYQLKKDKLNLEKRLQNLERENINIRANHLSPNPIAFAGTDDFEPVRAVINDYPESRQSRLSQDVKSKTRNSEYEPSQNMIKTSYINTSYNNPHSILL